MQTNTLFNVTGQLIFAMPPLDHSPLTQKTMNLLDYNIDPKTAFLPNPPPLNRLPAYYEPWESIMDRLNGLILAGKLRSSVLKVDKIDLVTSTEYHSSPILGRMATGLCGLDLFGPFFYYWDSQT